MKKSTFILAVAAVSFALVGCEKKSSVEQQSSGELIEKTFYANQGGKEKTTLDPATLATLWSEGDAIKVYPSTGGAGNDFTLESGAGESSATFTGLTTLSDVYVAFYPAENAKSISGSAVTFNIPATQAVTAAGSFNTNTVPMVGYTTDNTLAMLNVGSLFELKLKAKEGTPKVVKIELVGNNGENLAGDFTVDASVSGQPTAIYSANGAKTITINCGEYESDEYKGIEINDSEYTYFYFSIPAGVFTKGFTAILTDADDKEAEVTTTADIHKDAAKITAFTADDVEFTNCRHCKYTETVKDICGNTYNLVTIGSQTWMAENMRCNKYSDGTDVPTTDEWDWDCGPYYFDKGEHGYLYDWPAAMQFSGEESKAQTGGYPGPGLRQGICPNGFHIPSVAEFNDLHIHLSKTESGYKYGSAQCIKSCDGWIFDVGAVGYNSACFSGESTGYYFPWGETLEEVGYFTNYWSTDARTYYSAYTLSLEYNASIMICNYEREKDKGLSVRCLKD